MIFIHIPHYIAYRLLLNTAKVYVNQVGRYGVCPMLYAQRHGITDVLEPLEAYSLRG